MTPPRIALCLAFMVGCSSGPADTGAQEGSGHGGDGGGAAGGGKTGHGGAGGRAGGGGAGGMGAGGTIGESGGPGPSGGGKGGEANGGNGGEANGGNGGEANGGNGGEANGGNGSVDAAVDAPDPLDPPDSGAADSASDAKYWRSPCPKEWTREQCCMHYCTCMAQHCSPQQPANCQATCVASTSWRLDCRVEQCFESLDPCCPKDAVTHCNHAIEKPLKCQGLKP